MFVRLFGIVSYANRERVVGHADIVFINIAAKLSDTMQAFLSKFFEISDTRFQAVNGFILCGNDGIYLAAWVNVRLWMNIFLSLMKIFM